MGMVAYPSVWDTMMSDLYERWKKYEEKGQQ